MRRDPGRLRAKAGFNFGSLQAVRLWSGTKRIKRGLTNADIQYTDFNLEATAESNKKLFTDPVPRDKELVFEDYELQFPEIYLIYRVGEKRYRSGAKIDLPIDLLSQLNRQVRHPLFVHLGLAFAASHFLLSDFAVVHIACATLGNHELKLLEQALVNALGEFRYRQGLDPSREVKLTSSGQMRLRPLPFPNAQAKALMLSGGGKDSCVSADLPKHPGVEFSWLNAFPNSTRDDVIERSGVSNKYSVRFRVSKEIPAEAAYDCGVHPYLHAICAASLIVGYLTGHRRLVTRTEHSADDPNLVYNGVPVNHQSGSIFVFEALINEFVRRAVLQDTLLCSIARSFTDLRLCEIFKNFPKYFDAFLSCNEAMGTKR